MFIPAHTKLVYDRENMYAEIIEWREEKILQLLEKTKSIKELVAILPIYGKKLYMKEILDFFGRVMSIWRIRGILKM